MFTTRIVLGLFAFFFAGVLTLLNEQLSNFEWFAILLLVISVLLCLSCLIVIYRQPAVKNSTSFAVPFVPWLPGLSILSNIYLMTTLDVFTWLRFGVWILVGLVIYFGYGVWNSDQRPKNLQKIEAARAEGVSSTTTTSKEELVH